jgi:hypothetical protein
MRGIMPGLTIRGHGRLRMTEGPPICFSGRKADFSVKNSVTEKYGGDFAISCDAEKFQAVVML